MRPKRRSASLRQRLHLRLARDVDCERERGSPIDAAAVRARPRVAVGDDHARALGDERRRDRGADAGGAAGDDRDAAFEPAASSGGLVQLADSRC